MLMFIELFWKPKTFLNTRAMIGEIDCIQIKLKVLIHTEFYFVQFELIYFIFLVLLNFD